jgi:hypothetical protein
MKEKNYDKPRLIPLDTGYNTASGSCTTGDVNTCGAGTGIGSTGGGQCLDGQYAGSCSIGSSVNYLICSRGNSASTCVDKGQGARPICSPNGQARKA